MIPESLKFSHWLRESCILLILVFQSDFFLSSAHSLQLTGGFNPIEKYESNWIISPNSGKNKKYLKPPARRFCPPKKHHCFNFSWHFLASFPANVRIIGCRLGSCRSLISKPNKHMGNEWQITLSLVLMTLVMSQPPVEK